MNKRQRKKEFNKYLKSIKFTNSLMNPAIHKARLRKQFKLKPKFLSNKPTMKFKKYTLEEINGGNKC